MTVKGIPATEAAGALIASRYRVEQVLGRGGMSVVYRVLDQQTNRRVALKRCSTADPTRTARLQSLLQREYYTLAQLAHPHIIAVYDYGIDARGPYYTMELLQGSDLQATERLPWQSTCRALHDVASSLAMLHSRGLLHRDVSLRNVYWSAEGHAKLIDFGAMMTMGIAKQILGTPPFVAPEAMQLQMLDGRTDLFALGALGYRLLTGRHAFPARKLSELRDVWRSRPAAPNKLVPEIPAELSSLVSRMLTLERAGRPQSAGEIIEQLRAIARIEPEELADITRSYLTTPSLVGRESAQVATRKQVLGLARSEGSVVMFRGVPGAGRSRMLDACALEGKLVGATVVRADARDAVDGEWAVARAIGRQLITQFPAAAKEAARLSSHVSSLLEEPGSDAVENVTMTGVAPDRSIQIRELREWLLALCSNQRLILIVDDIERIDEVSLAWLAAVAHKAERLPLLIALAAVDDPQESIPETVKTLMKVAKVIDVEDLHAADTEALMRSVFGDVANLSMCAARMHAISRGNPRALMDLAQHLVSTGRAYYQAGTWLLPQALAEDDLPTTLSASLLARLNALSEQARELADILTLTEDDAPLISQYKLLTEHRNTAFVYRAVDELVVARIVTVEGDRCYFAQRGFVALLQQFMPPDRRRSVHRRVSQLLASSGGDSFRRAHHLLAAGMDAQALALLEQIDLSARIAPSTLLAKAIEQAEASGARQIKLHRLRMGLLVAAPYSMDYDNFRRVAPVVIARLERDSGLARYRELVDVPESERLGQAIAHAQQVYLETPVESRVYTVIDAIRELARLVAAVASAVVPLFDTDTRDELVPDISPLYPLSPTLAVIGKILGGVALWGRGQHMQARLVYEDVLARLAQPDHAGFDDAHYQRTWANLQLMLAAFEAGYGIERAEHRAKLFERDRELRVNAWRVRALLNLAIGNSAEATKCMRRAEVLQAQEGLKERFANSTAAIELILRSRLGDLIGVKAQLPILASLATRYHGWRPVELLGRSRYCELQGDLATALSLTTAGLDLARPGRHPFFSALAASHISLLAGLGRLPEAVDMTNHYLDLCRQSGIADSDIPVRGALALADAGLCDRAVTLLQAHIDEAEQLGRIGFAVGMIYEARARVAIAAGDSQAFEDFSARCAREYEKSNNPALAVRLTALIEAARDHGLIARPEVTEVSRSLRAMAAHDERETLQSRLEECVGAADRSRCALTLLLQNTLSRLGYLYLTSEGKRLALTAFLPDEPTDTGVSDWVHTCAVAWSEAADRRDEFVTQSMEGATQSAEAVTVSNEGLDESTASGMSSEESEVSLNYVDDEGRSLHAVLLVCGSGPSGVLAGVLVVQPATSEQVYLPQTLTSALAAELLRCGDAKSWT